MGLFSKLFGGINQAFGGADQELLVNGLPGRGQLTSFEMTSSTVTIANGLEERICNIGLQVMLDGRDPYAVTVHQRIPEIYIPQLTAQGAVAVRVDPADPNRVAIDLNAPIPEVTLARQTGPGSAAWLLANGTPVEVVLVQSDQLGMRNADGHEIYKLKLTVASGVETPYQLEVGNSVPATALPLLYPGARLHARKGEGPNDIVVDWEKGLAEPAAPPGS